LFWSKFFELIFLLQKTKPKCVKKKLLWSGTLIFSKKKNVFLIQAFCKRKNRKKHFVDQKKTFIESAKKTQENEDSGSFRGCQ
jgi:hypothetical protein